jgi:hypothetical protein
MTRRCSASAADPEGTPLIDLQTPVAADATDRRAMTLCQIVIAREAIV